MTASKQLLCNAAYKGNGYYALGDSLDYVYLVDLSTNEVTFSDFVV